MTIPAVDVIRLGPATKTRLSTLKRRTGVDNWNVLCRWAFCLSLSDNTPVGERHDDPGAGIEMTWKTFAGDFSPLYMALLAQNAESVSLQLDERIATSLVRQHISRGVTRLVSQKEITALPDFLKA
jgi:DNA sulfur modification protein DndE